MEEQFWNSCTVIIPMISRFVPFILTDGYNHSIYILWSQSVRRVPSHHRVRQHWPCNETALIVRWEGTDCMMRRDRLYDESAPTVWWDTSKTRVQQHCRYTYTLHSPPTSPTLYSMFADQDNRSRTTPFSDYITRFTSNNQLFAILNTP